MTVAQATTVVQADPAAAPVPIPIVTGGTSVPLGGLYCIIPASEDCVKADVCDIFTSGVNDVKFDRRGRVTKNKKVRLKSKALIIYGKV